MSESNTCVGTDFELPIVIVEVTLLLIPVAALVVISRRNSRRKTLLAESAHQSALEETQHRLDNLMARFRDVDRETVKQVLLDCNGHAGNAAKQLHVITQSGDPKDSSVTESKDVQISPECQAYATRRLQSQKFVNPLHE
jgi:hypothetical protein